MSISPIFYEQIFCMKVFCADFMCLPFGFVIFCQKDFGAKAVNKMLVKMTPKLAALQYRLLNFKILMLGALAVVHLLMRATCSFAGGVGCQFCTKRRQCK